jgi:hypothetical protein
VGRDTVVGTSITAEVTDSVGRVTSPVGTVVALSAVGSESPTLSVGAEEVPPCVAVVTITGTVVLPLSPGEEVPSVQAAISNMTAIQTNAIHKEINRLIFKRTPPFLDKHR